MASLGITFDRDELPDSRGVPFDVIPEGWYEAQIKAAEEKKTKAGTGSYINIQFKLDSGRVVFGTITLRNPNTTAEEIGRQQLKQLMGAIGLRTLSDTDQLIGAHLIIKVTLSRPQAGYDQRNEARSYKAIEGGVLPMPAKSVENAAVSATPKAPWAK